MNKSIIKKIALLAFPFFLGITTFFVSLIFKDYIKIEDVNIATLIVSILFTMFGFLITAMTIIIGFMKESDVIYEVMRKGHFLKFIFSIAILFVLSVLSLVVVICGLDYYILVMSVFSGTTILLYIVIILLFLCYQFLRLRKNKL